MPLPSAHFAGLERLGIDLVVLHEDELVLSCVVGRVARILVQIYPGLGELLEAFLAVDVLLGHVHAVLGGRRLVHVVLLVASDDAHGLAEAEQRERGEVVLVAAAVPELLHHGVHLLHEHLAQLRAELVHLRVLPVVQPRVVEHLPHVGAEAAGVQVREGVQLLPDGGQVHGVLDHVEVVRDLQGFGVHGDAERTGFLDLVHRLPHRQQRLPEFVEVEGNGVLGHLIHFFLHRLVLLSGLGVALLLPLVGLQLRLHVRLDIGLDVEHLRVQSQLVRQVAGNVLLNVRLDRSGTRQVADRVALLVTLLQPSVLLLLQLLLDLVYLLRQQMVVLFLKQHHEPHAPGGTTYSVTCDFEHLLFYFPGI